MRVRDSPASRPESVSLVVRHGLVPVVAQERNRAATSTQNPTAGFRGLAIRRQFGQLREVTFGPVSVELLHLSTLYLSPGVGVTSVVRHWDYRVMSREAVRASVQSKVAAVRCGSWRDNLGKPV